ncbi:MAG TPA: hypothetical protein VLP43_04725 [Solirubrobacteraceae bacterium]|nr:hypothetical protein [Solirubrobacteraceae bacterium]
MSEVQHQAPPAGEEVHLPGPSLIPLFSAVGITLIVIGTTVFPPIPMVIGAIIFVVTTVRWIRDTRRDVAALPEEH